MTLALSLFAAGLSIIGLIALKRRPTQRALLGFGIVLLIVFGILSLGLTGSWLERLLRPLMPLLGLAPQSEESYWRIAMFLSLLLPMGLGLAYEVSKKARGAKWLLFLGIYLVYALLCNIFAHLLVRAL